MKVLIACEESQRVCVEFRERGHEAYSCDIQECSGGHPEWHIQGDSLMLINGSCSFTTMDGSEHRIQGEWDLLIAHPPCTYLSVIGNKYFNVEKYGEKALKRQLLREDAEKFFMKIWNANCKRICIENPVGFINKKLKPTQIIHPYMFAENKTDIENYQMKKTCLWLKNLPKLLPTNCLGKPDPVKYTKGKAVYFVGMHGKIKGIVCDKNSAKARSKTFPGIAKAMAEQWENPETQLSFFDTEVLE